MEAMNGADLKTLYDRCIRLTAENKLTKSNVWDMDIIYHMPNIIRDHSSGENFSFQKASCGLDAGVSIYGKRVDSVFDTARDTLYGFKGVDTMVDHDDEEGDAHQSADRDLDSSQDIGSSQDQDPNSSHPMKPKSRKSPLAFVDPSSTLADPESLKAKEQDVTFDLDPLFTKMTKLFDEAGLLLLNLGSYSNCEIMFESSQVPSSEFPTSEDSKTAAAAVSSETTSGLALAHQCLPGLLIQANRGSHRITPTFDKMLQLQAGDSRNRETLFPDADSIVSSALAEDALYHKKPSSLAPKAAPAPPVVISKVKALAASFEARIRGEEVESQSPIVMQTSQAVAVDKELTGEAATVVQLPSFHVDDDGFVIGAADYDGDDGAPFGADSFSSDGEEEGDGEEVQLKGRGVETELSVWLARQEKQQESLAQPTKKTLQLRGGASGAFWRFSSSAAAAAQKKASNSLSADGATKKSKKASVSSSALKLDSDDEDPALEERMKMRGRPEESQLTRRPKAKTLMRQAQGSIFEAKSLFNVLGPNDPRGSSQISVLSIWRSHAQQSARSLSSNQRRYSTVPHDPPLGYNDDDDNHEDDGGGGGGGGRGWDENDDDDGGGEGEGYSAPLDDSVANKRKSLGQWAAAAEAAAVEAGLSGEEPDLLIKYGGQPAPKVLEKLEVNYDRVAKVVDVKLLKEKLHGSLKEKLGAEREPKRDLSLVSFQEVITSLKPQLGGPATKDLSVHLCFICLLHLANEHSLDLRNDGDLDRLNVSYKL